MTARRDFAGAAAQATLSADINATALSISISTASGWPTGANGEFYIVIDRGHASEEKCLVLSRSGTTLTLASTAKRGVDGTTAASHTAGVTVEHCLAAADLDEANDFIANPGAVGDISASAPGDAADAGDTGKWADAGHVHEREAATTSGRGVVYRSADITASQGSITAATDVTGMTAIAVTGDGVRRIQVKVKLHNVLLSSAGQVIVSLKEGATLINTIAKTYNAAVSVNVEGTHDFVPSSGSHTYKITVTPSTGTLTIFNGSAQEASWVEATDVGT